VKDIAMARRIAPGGLLPGSQAPARIGNRIVRLQPLFGGVKEMHGPGIGVAMFVRSKQIAVSRLGIDACQYRCCAMEDLVVQAYTNA
jgi:hypothetical protein